MRFAVILMLFLELGLLSGCGVKGKPLPPLADTPEEQDRLDDGRESAQPSPTPSPSPTAKPKKKRKSQ